MSKNLGKVQRGIIDYLKAMYEVNDEPDKYGIGKVIYVYGNELINNYYDLEPDEIKDFPLVKKQTVYNAIDGLEKRGWIGKENVTTPFDDAPPKNEIRVSAYINGNQIYNYNFKKQ